jgi:hypothetical protein
VWPESSSSAARTSPRTGHWNPGLDIRVIFEEGRATATATAATAAAAVISVSVMRSVGGIAE